MTRLNVLSLTYEDYERAAEEYGRNLPLEHFMEARAQGTQREITLESLALLRARRPDVQVFNELLVQYPLEERIVQVVPDNMIVLGIEPVRAAGSFNLPFEKNKPFCMLEYVSPNTLGKDYEDSFQKYEKDLRVPYCFFYYPEKQDLQIYHHDGRRYRPVPRNAAGRQTIPELDLEIGLHEGWVRFWYQGELLPLPGEIQQALDTFRKFAEQEQRRAEQEKKRAEQERKRAERAKRRAEQDKARARQENERAEQEKQRAELERARAEQAQRNAEAEKAARLAAEAEVARLRALLEGRGPERPAEGPGSR